MNRVSLQPAFILHTRPYRDTSLLLDVLSLEHGRVHLLARGVKGKRKTGHFLQPFSALLLSWQGRTDLMSLSQAELAQAAPSLVGEALLCGFYVNEVLVRVLHRGDPCPGIYKIYALTLKNLMQSVTILPALRLFEKHLLAELGYALSLVNDVQGSPLNPEKIYRFIPSMGFACALPSANDDKQLFFTGKSLIALREEQFHCPVMLKEMKRLLQQALAPLLGDRPLKSRSCFV